MTLATATFNGVPEGMNLAVPPHEIQDDEAAYLQDFLINDPGIINRRGPVEDVTGLTSTTFANPIIGITHTPDPQGNLRVGVLTSTGSFRVFDTSGAPMTAVAITGATNASPISITATAHGLSTGNTVSIWGVGGNTAANGIWTITSTGANTFTLNTSTGNGAYTAGGFVDNSAYDPTLGFTPSTSPYSIFQTAPALGGGAWIGVFNQYESDSLSGLALWRGASAADYTNNIAVTRGAKAVTGTGTTFTANMVGGFLFDANSRYVGTISAVNSTTSATLEQNAFYTIAAGANSGTIKSLRGFMRRISTGLITTSVGNTAVTGSGTKFNEQLVDNTGTANPASWDLFRASDNAFIARVASVGSATGLTLQAGGAAIALANEPYFAIQADTTAAVIEDTHVQQSGSGVNAARTVFNSVGNLTATYASRQWYANLPRQAGAYGNYVDRVWFSEEIHPEAVDLSPASGNYIPIPSTDGTINPIKAIVSTQSGLLVLKENEAFLITGVDPSSFAVRKLLDDGAPSGMTALPIYGGALWAGKNGIYYFDGTQAKSISSGNLGLYYSTAVATFDPRSNRMWAMTVRDHYVLFIESATPAVGPTKGSTTTLPTKLTLTFYFQTKAWGTFYNVDLRGAVVLPGQNTAWYTVTDTNTRGRVAQASSLFDKTGPDTITCSGNSTPGPSSYVETKHYTLKDALRGKVWKQILMHYFLTGSNSTLDALNIDVVSGMNSQGVTLQTTWVATSSTWDAANNQYGTWASVYAANNTWLALGNFVWSKKKIPFLIRDPLLGFRIYESPTAVSISSVKLGSWQLGYKPLRAGRI